MKNATLAISFAMAILVAVAPNVFAWGVAYENNQLNLMTGQTYRFYTSLQNMDDSSKTVSITLQGDIGIAEIEGDSSISLSPNTRSHPVYIKITIPSDEPKESYSVKVVYVTETGSSGIAIATSRSVQININVDLAECHVDADCESNERCQSTECINVVCSSGYEVYNHGCRQIQQNDDGSGSDSSPSEPPSQPDQPIQPNQETSNQETPVQGTDSYVNEGEIPLDNDFQSESVASDNFGWLLPALLMIVIGVGVAGFIVYKKGYFADEEENPYV